MASKFGPDGKLGEDGEVVNLENIQRKSNKIAEEVVDLLEGTDAVLVYCALAGLMQQAIASLGGCLAAKGPGGFIVLKAMMSGCSDLLTARSMLAVLRIPREIIANDIDKILDAVGAGLSEEEKAELVKLVTDGVKDLSSKPDPIKELPQGEELNKLMEKLFSEQS